jgi:hypothetical protein
MNLRMYRRPMGSLAVFNQEGPSRRRQQSPNIRNDILEARVRGALGALQDAEGKLYALIVNIENQVDDTTDLAHLYPFVLLFLLRRNHGHIPFAALLCASTSFVVAPCS